MTVKLLGCLVGGCGPLCLWEQRAKVCRVNLEECVPADRIECDFRVLQGNAGIEALATELTGLCWHLIETLRNLLTGGVTQPNSGFAVV